MVATHGSSLGHERSSLDWRAACIVVLLHAALVLTLLNHRNAQDPAHPARMMLVRLWDAALERKPERLPSPAAARRARHANNNTTAATRQPAARPQPERRPRVAEGREAIVDGSATAAAGAAATITASNGASGSSAASGDAGYTGPRFKPPRVTRRVALDYPATALHARQQGTVEVVVTIAADGRAREAHLSRSSGALALDDAAVAAALAYTYQPGERYGKPVEAQGFVSVDWKIGMRAVERHMPVAQSPEQEAEQKRLQCLGSRSHEIELMRNASLCGPPRRR